MKKKLPMAAWILIAMVLGIIVGYMIFSSFPDKKAAKEIADYVSIISDVFLRLIKMLIGPLVFSTLVVGIAHMGDAKSVGRVFGKAIGWFLTASLISLVIGLVMANLLKPGENLGLPLPDIGASANLATSKFTLKDFVSHTVPKSFVEAMANNEILQIVVFAIFMGVAATAVGERGRQLVAVADEVAHVMLKITNYVMLVAPLAVFAAVAATITTQGLGILVTYGKFIAEFYLCLFVLWLLLVLAGSLFLGPRVITLMRYIREPFLLAFSTASSESAYPRTVEQLERFGVSNRIVSFVLPLGYSFNLDGTMMYCTFATIFIAQAYGIELSFGTQIAMLLLLMLTSKGMAGVPRASLVVIAATLSTFGIPEAGILLIMGIDQFLDMGRSATNVVGNSIATVVVGKWEGEYNPGKQDEMLEGVEEPEEVAQPA
jgi:Na+/H+-dicarboxylate symporter